MLHGVSGVGVWADDGGDSSNTTVMALISSTSSTAWAQGSVMILSPIRLSKMADLAFGSVVVPAGQSGKVVMNTSGVRTGTNVVLSPIAMGNPASFRVLGKPNSTFSVSLPASTILSGPGASNMVVNEFTSSPATMGRLGGQGSAALAIGATWRIDANQPMGNYVGNFTVTVNYD